MMRKRLTLIFALTSVAAMAQLAQTARAGKPVAVSPELQAASLASSVQPAQAPRLHSVQAPTVMAAMDFGRMPLHFIANQGQMDGRVAYYVQGKDKSVYFTPGGVTFALSQDSGAEGKRPSPASWGRWTRKLPAKSQVKTQDAAPGAAGRWVVKLDFVGANRNVRPGAREETGAVVSYFSGRPKDWHTGLPTFSRIVYSNLWPGIDLAYSGTVNRLKYEFVVHPGADPSAIRLAYRGVTDLKVDDGGRLAVTTPAGGFADDTPVAYQEINGNRVAVPLAYRILESDASEAAGEKGQWPEASIDEVHTSDAAGQSHAYAFSVGAYDATQPLILDPAVLVYCGYVGGSNADDVRGIAVDSSGNAYIAGKVPESSVGFPTVVGPDLTHNGSGDFFVAKVKADGTGLVYCGFIGGSQTDRTEGFGHAIAVDSQGCAYVVGSTNSPQATFPVLGGPGLTQNGNFDAFVAKVKADGTGLVYCGYIGGSAEDTGWAIAVDSSGCAYVTGLTYSDETTIFPVAVGPSLTGYGEDAFVAKVKADGSGLVYCGFIGGYGYEHGDGIAVDSTGAAYVVGTTESTEAQYFPVTVGPDLVSNGAQEAYIAKVKPDGTGFAYCGYIGGAGDDGAADVVVDAAGNAYVGGATASDATTFPVKVGPDLTANGSHDGFIARVKADGTGLVYCGYVGGAASDSVGGIALDGSGCLYVCGVTSSTQATFPVSGGPDLTENGGVDAFVAKAKADGTGLIYCGYIGGSALDGAAGIAVDGSGNAYVTGQTYSIEATFPVTVGPDLSFNGGLTDVFVAKISSLDLWTPMHAVGDFDGDGAEEVAVDFGSTGIYLYDSGAWSQISSANPESLLAADVDGDNVAEIIADLGATGLWLWSAGVWGQLSGVNVEGLAAGDVDADGTDELLGDFGTVGLWLYNGGAWSQLSGVNADQVTTANLDGTGGAEIIGDFGTTGLWMWNTGAWSQLSGVNADYVTPGKWGTARYLLGDFGTTGLWLWNTGIWTQLSGINADYMIAANTDGDSEDEALGDFGATGFWLWNSGAWTILSGLNADFMIRADVDGNGSDEVAGDFGIPGLWLWNSGAWSQLGGVNPEYLLAGDFDGDNADEVMADFGALGLWLWNAGAWAQISPLNPE